MDFRARKDAGASGTGVWYWRALLLRRQLRGDRSRLGLFTLSMHLSRISVHEGQHVQGQLLG